jgi:hypothetical protein
MAAKCATAGAPPPGPPPPFFSDMGKNARGLFARCYNMGTIGLTFRSAVPKSGIVFGSSISHNLQDGAIFGGTELRFAYPSQKLNYVQKWNSNNEVVAELSGADVFTPGFGFGVTSLYAPSSGEYNFASKFSYQQEYVSTMVQTDVFKNKNMSGSVVLGTNGFSVGAAGNYLLEKREVDKVEYGVAYDSPSFGIFGTTSNGKEVTGGVYVKPSDCVETGLAFKHEFGDDPDGKNAKTTLGLAGRITLDQNASVGAKIDTNGKLMTCYEQKIGNVGLVFSSAIDTNNLDKGAHKIGLGITLET